ncbi:MAG TPA: hypothetical protein DC001_01705 [Clostridiales bacterium]|nr:hypothetical protein [Clostridiales bacterium]
MKRGQIKYSVLSAAAAVFGTVLWSRRQRRQAPSGDSGDAVAAAVLPAAASREEPEKMRREFSANVSHELKTPITSISGYAEMMMTGMVKRDDVPKLSEKIYHESQRLIALIDDIIRLSRLDEGSVGNHAAEVNLLAASRRVADRLEHKAESFRVCVTVSGEDVMILGDEQLVDEMIANLCDNAIKYNRPGGRVCIWVGRRGGAPYLTVSDDGIGIEPEHMERIFERFYRIDKSRSRETGGTGLGLSIVKHSAAWHKATVKAESTPGKGTRISVIFDGKGGE